MEPFDLEAARDAVKSQGGFTWSESVLGYDFWVEIIQYEKFHLIPKKQSVEPNAIIQNMLDKGMAVWAFVSDKSYDDARANIGRNANRVTEYYTTGYYPVWTGDVGWKYAVPIDIATMTEITEVPK